MRTWLKSTKISTDKRYDDVEMKKGRREK